ncbi:MAG: XisI protein [Chloroflexota bacterium]
MEKITLYQKYIQEILYSYHDGDKHVNNSQIIFDTEHNHYQLLTLGWRDELKRILHIVAHVDIIDGKIWVQRDFTEPSIADQLVAKGVPNTDIVLGFHPPYKRPYTDFAIQ